MPSSTSTQHSQSPSIPIPTLEVSNNMGSKDQVVPKLNYGPFAPVHSDAKILASCAEVGDTANTSTQPPKPTPPSKTLYPTLNCQGFIVIEQTAGADLGPQPPQFLSSPPPPAMVAFVVKSQDEDDPGVQYNMARNVPFFSVYNDYAGKLGYAGNDITLRRDVERVSPLETPDDIDLDDGDAIIATPRRGEKNMDTRYKVFTLHACTCRPLKVKFKARLQASLHTVTHMWCEYTQMDKDKVVLVRNNRPIPQFGNVGQSQIENQDVVYAFSLN